MLSESQLLLNIFFLLFSSWGTRDKIFPFGCAWRWRCLASSFLERRWCPVWEDSRDEGNSCWTPTLGPLFSPHQKQMDQTFRDGTVRWNTGLELWNKKEMKKTIVTAGRRLNTNFFLLFFFFYFLFSLFIFPTYTRRSHCVWGDIFEIFVRWPILYRRLLFWFENSSLEEPSSVQGTPYSLQPQFTLTVPTRTFLRKRSMWTLFGDTLWMCSLLCWRYWLSNLDDSVAHF